MHLYVEAKLAMVEKPEPFNDENGKPVVYYINHLKTDEGAVLVANSGTDFSEHESKRGVAKLRVRTADDAFRQAGGSYKGLVKLSLAGFTPGDQASPEEEIA